MNNLPFVTFVLCFNARLRNFLLFSSTVILHNVLPREYHYKISKCNKIRSEKLFVYICLSFVRVLNALTYGFSYIMRYIVLVIEKMTRTIYLIMYSRPTYTYSHRKIQDFYLRHIVTLPQNRRRVPPSSHLFQTF